MGTLVGLLFSVVQASSACITLAPNETAVVDPSEYFGDDVSNIQIKSAGNPHASILNPENPTALFRIQTKGENWYFGPSVQVGRLQFFTVVYPSEMEVWRADGDWVEEVWTVQASVGQVTPLLTGELAAFVYWTLSDLRLFVVDLNSSDLTAKEISGVETTNVSHIVVCAKKDLLFTLEPLPLITILTTYEISYESFVAVKTETKSSEVIEGEVIDALCEVHCCILTNTTLISLQENPLQRVLFPTSFGVPKSLSVFGNLNEIYAKGSKGSVLMTLGNMHFLPGVLSVLEWDSFHIYIEDTDSRLTLAISGLSRLKRVVPLHQEVRSADDFLWLSGPQHRYPSLLVKRGAYIEGFAVSLGDSILLAPSHPAPYTLNLCGTDAAKWSVCLDLTVATLPHQTGDIVIEGCRGEDPSKSTLSWRAPLTAKVVAGYFDFTESLSGANIGYALTIPALPPYLSATFACFPQQSISEKMLEIENDEMQFICAGLCQQNVVALVKRFDEVIEVSKGNSEVLFNTTLSVLSCDIDDAFYALYAEDQEQGYLCIYSNNGLRQYPLHTRGFLSMLVAGSHILVLMKNGVHVVGVECVLWQRLAGEYLEMRESEGTLMLRSARYFEVYVLRGSTYVSRGRVPAPPSVSEFAVLRQEVIVLHANNSAAVFYRSDFSRLVFKFAVELDCTALGLFVRSCIAMYRCPAYIQVLSLNSKKNSFFQEKVDFDSIPIYMKLGTMSLYEVHRKSGTLEVWEIRIISSRRNIILYSIKAVDGYGIPGTTGIQGLLAVSNSLSQRSFTVNITLENHGAVIVPSARSLPTLQYSSADSTYTLELQWGDTYRLSPLDLFQGHSMQVTAKSDWVHTEVSSPVSVLYSVPFPHSYGVVALAPEISTLFAVSDSELIASEYQCEMQHCKVVSKHLIYITAIGLHGIQLLELIVAFNSLVYLYVFGYSMNSADEITHLELVLCYDYDSHSFTETLHLGFNLIRRQYHVIPGSPTAFHLLLYSTVLEHCAAEGKQPARCDEAAVPALVQIESVGSVKASGQCWHVYAVTKSLRLFTMELCEELTLLRASPLRVEALCKAEFAKVSGDRLVVVGTFWQIFSLPELTLLREMPPWDTIALDQKAQTPVVASEYNTQLLMQKMKGSEYHLLDLLAPANSLVLAQVHFETFTFTANDYGVGIANHTASVLRFSRGEIVLTGDSGWVETVSTEVTVTASNEMGVASARIRVVLPARKWLLWVIAVAIVGVSGAALMRFRRSREMINEVEMERIK